MNLQAHRPKSIRQSGGRLIKQDRRGADCVWRCGSLSSMVTGSLDAICGMVTRRTHIYHRVHRLKQRRQNNTPERDIKRRPEHQKTNSRGHKGGGEGEKKEKERKKERKIYMARPMLESTAIRCFSGSFSVLLLLGQMFLANHPCLLYCSRILRSQLSCRVDTAALAAKSVLIPGPGGGANGRWGL